MSTRIETTIKRRITEGRNAADLARDPAQLHIAEHDGRMWASNRYWLTFAGRVKPLLDQFNLDTGPGAFTVNGTIRKNSGEGPRFGYQLEGWEKKYTVGATPVKVAGLDVLVQYGRGLRAVYQAPDGALLGLDPETLEWLSDGLLTSRELDLGPDDRMGAVKVMTRPDGSMAGTSVVLAADVIRTVEPAGYDRDPDTGKSAYRPAVTENLGPRLIAMMMATRLEG